MAQSELLSEDAVVYRWEWRLAASPAALWPLVSDTNRINRLASMAPASFTEAPVPEGGTERTGATHMLGLGVTWAEHPFEWAYPQGFSVLREFHNGVLKAYRSSVALVPEGTGTRLVHQVELIPRVGLMAPFVRREGPKQQRNWDHAYRAIDSYLAGQGPWPFEAKARIRLRGAQAALAAEIDVDSPHPALERRLFEHVLGQPEAELSHVRPYALADQWGADREAVLACCLYAARRQLLVPQWSLLCPHCRGPKGTVARPELLGAQIYCNACNLGFSPASDDLAELSFRPHPNYRRVGEATFCVGGPGSQPHVLFHGTIWNKGARDLALPAAPGAYRLRGPRIKQPCDLVYVAEADGEEAVEPPCFEFGPEGFEGPTHTLRGSKLCLRLLNTGERPLEVMLETLEERGDTLTLAQLRRLALEDPCAAELLAPP